MSDVKCKVCGEKKYTLIDGMCMICAIKERNINMTNKIIFEGEANVDMFRLGRFSEGVWVAILNIAFPTNQEIRIKENEMIKIKIEKPRTRMTEPMITDIAYFYCTEKKKEVNCEDRFCDKFTLDKNITDKYPKWKCYDCAKVTLKEREINLGDKNE